MWLKGLSPAAFEFEWSLLKWDTEQKSIFTCASNQLVSQDKKNQFLFSIFGNRRSQ